MTAGVRACEFCTTLRATFRQIFSICFCKLRTPASRQYLRAAIIKCAKALASCLVVLHLAGIDWRRSCAPW
eukprot:49160-Pleurochrysis_carterae.AAC.1